MRNARRIREQRGESLRDVEEATGIDHVTIYKFEKGGGMLLKNLLHLSSHYRESIEDLQKDAPAEAAVTA